MKNLMDMGLIILSLFLLIWVQTGFFIQTRKSELATHLVRMSRLLCLWMLLRAAILIAPTDILFWLFTGFALASFCLACHEWNHVSYRLGLHRNPPRNMLAASLALMVMFSVMIAGNPWHGLVFNITTLTDTRPGPLYFIICATLIAMFLNGSLSIGRLLLHDIRQRPRYLIVLFVQILSGLLFLILFIRDLMHQDVSLLTSLPGTYSMNLIVLMFLLRQPDAARIFALPEPNWPPDALKAMDEAILTFNGYGRMLSWNRVMPELAEGISGFAEWLALLRTDEVGEEFVHAVEQAWGAAAETASGSFFLNHPRRRISWQLDAVRRTRGRIGGHILFLRDTTQNWLLEEESASLQIKLATVRQAIASYGEIERQTAMEREMALTLEVLQSNLKGDLHRIEEELDTGSRVDFDPGLGAGRFQDAFLQIRKTLLNLRRGLHDLILMDAKSPKN